MSIEVMPYSPEWATQFEELDHSLRAALRNVDIVAIEHVGSTAVPGLAAKPILDVDIIVRRAVARDAIAALTAAGYMHRGDLGVTDREAFNPPDENPPRHVYLCVENTLHVRNHLAVRDSLRQNPSLRDRYAEVKLDLARDPDMDIGRYIAGKSLILQEVLAASDLTSDEKRKIFELNTS